MSARLAWVLSALIGAAGALAVFPVPVLLGTAEYWHFPHGFVGGSWADMGTAVSGYTAFVQEPFQWPLFRLATLGDGGTSVLFTDSTPLLCLVGRGLFRVTGRVVPLYGAWAGLCLAGMALASTALVRALGARSLPAAVAASLIGVSAPALLARWGHLSLMGHWVIPLSFAAYIGLHRQARLGLRRACLVMTGLGALALLIHPYLFFMAAGVLLVAPLQAAWTRRMSAVAAAGSIGLTTMTLLGLMGAMGYWEPQSLEPARGFGSFSANLMSPFIPQMSGLLPGPDFIVQGTFGQYEGFAYLGAGLLVLLLLGLRGLAGRPWTGHPFLLAVVLGFSVLAVSNRVYAAQIQLAFVPLPEAALPLLGVVRASGRFVWLPLYLTAGLAVAAVARLPRAGLILLVAGGLQWADAAPLRARVRATMAEADIPVLDTAAWEAALGRVDQVLLDPPWLCMQDVPEWYFHVGMEVQLMVSRAGRTTNTVYAARGRPSCAPRSAGPGTLTLRLRMPGRDADGAQCRSGAGLTACSGILDPALLQRLAEVRTGPG